MANRASAKTKYKVREFFVLHLETVDSRGRKTRQAYNPGSELELDREQYLKYRHQIEPINTSS